jgi:hypothetical protein
MGQLADLDDLELELGWSQLDQSMRHFPVVRLFAQAADQNGDVAIDAHGIASRLLRAV